MSEFKKILEDFDFKVDPEKAVFDLFSRVISVQATLYSLKDLVFENLKQFSGKSEEELTEEFELFFSDHRRELLTDFISKYGKIPK
jgi:hypothetical protein